MVNFANVHSSIGRAQASILYCSTMSSPGAGRRTPKRRRTTTKSLSQLLDLNSPPAEGAGEGVPPFRILRGPHNEASSSITVQHNQASSSVPPATDEPYIGMHTCPIDVEAFDDDVVIYSSTSLPQARQRSIRTERVTVIIDDDSETIPESAGLMISSA
nr:unnamed protein product [Digitaria exilis]